MRRILAAMLAAALSACSYSPSADVLKALAGDPNSLCWVVTTPWGGSNLDRNHGCPGNQGPSGTTIIAPASMNMQVIKQ